MQIRKGDICILDPTNRRYKQTREGLIYLVCVSVKGLFFKKYVCCPIIDNILRYDKTYKFPKRVLVPIQDFSFVYTVIRSDPNEPAISNDDVNCIDKTVDLMVILQQFAEKVLVEDQKLLLDIIEHISYVRTYYDKTLRDKLQYYADRNDKEHEKH